MGRKVKDYAKVSQNGESACQIGFRIEMDTLNDLDKICQRECITRSMLVRRIIRQYVEENRMGGNDV